MSLEWLGFKQSRKKLTIVVEEKLDMVIKD